MLRPVQTLATLLANKTQHCWARVVATCWMKFDTGQTSSNNFQQVATTHNMVCKRSQHVGPNNVGLVGQQCCERLHGPLGSFAFQMIFIT